MASPSFQADPVKQDVDIPATTENYGHRQPTRQSRPDEHLHVHGGAWFSHEQRRVDARIEVYFDHKPWQVHARVRSPQPGRPGNARSVASGRCGKPLVAGATKCRPT